jgi:hypothetical protein
LELLRKFSPRGLEYQEIDRYLNVGKSLYTVLDRLEDRQLITKRRSLTDARRWVYCLPQYTTAEGNTTDKIDSTSLDTPPPTLFSSGVKLVTKSFAGKELDDSQHLFNTHSTTIQHPSNVGLVENAQTPDEEIDTEPQDFIQHSTKEEGERGCVEQEQFDSVLQTEKIANSSTTQKDTSSQSNSIDPASQQEAFTRKYQAVEVLNRDGEWISGYFVHKCLVVANLEGIERKYALVDELGGKYAFWGEVRLPRC